MNKKGFTLVELLAVIAILAILVMIALPNMISLFNEAKKNSFENEVKSIYKTAEEQWISDSINSQNEVTYSRCEDESCNNQLKLSGRKDLEYYIKIDKGGKVVNYVASDGVYQYSYSGDGLKVEDITGIVELSGSTDKIEISGTGVKNIATFVTRHNANAITPGDEVTIAGDNFYVISSNWQETVLIAKYDLNVSENAQDTSGTFTNVTKVRFSDVGYWDGCRSNGTMCTSSPEGLLSPYSDGGKVYCATMTDTNCPDVYDSNSNFYAPINAYTNKIATLSGAMMSGRTIYLEEAMTFASYSLDALNAIKDNNNGSFLTGTAGDKRRIFRITSSFEVTPPLISAVSSGIRPVLVVNTDAL